MKEEEFAKGVERLINPIEVGTIHLVQQLNGLLPKSIQKKIMESSGKQFPQMGFVVEPYSFFLFYEIKDLEEVEKLLPDGFKLIKTKVFDDDIPKYYVIFGCFRAHTSVFWGSRIEFYAIAENEETGLLSWIILDYDTNTIGYDKKNGLRGSNCKNGVITINHRGNVFVDFKRDDKSRELVFDCNIEDGAMKPLDQRLWLEGNLSVGYGKALDGSTEDIFSLKFEPYEVEKALDIPVENINIEINNWFPGIFEEKPSKIACFPYAQHFVSDSPGYTSRINNREELEKSIRDIDFSKIEVFSTKAMKVMFIVGMGMSFLITVILVVLLITKL
jgi:hypothetical protein